MTSIEPSPRTRSATRGGRARREQIERAAAEVLADDGYAAASVARIAERVGVSKGVVTYHFPSKDELLRGIAIRTLRECADAVAAAAARAGGPIEKLRATIVAELEFFAGRRVEFLALGEILGGRRDDAFDGAFDEVVARETAGLAGILAEGAAGGALRRIDADAAASMIAAAKTGLLDRWAADETVDLAAQAATLLDLVERGVVADGA